MLLLSYSYNRTRQLLFSVVRSGENSATKKGGRQFESKKNYLDDEENLKIARASAEIEADFYCRASRVEETIRWAKKLGAKKQLL